MSDIYDLSVAGVITHVCNDPMVASGCLTASLGSRASLFKFDLVSWSTRLDIFRFASLHENGLVAHKIEIYPKCARLGIPCGPAT
jgi:hypothetical protein